MNLIAVWLGCDNLPILVYLRGLPKLPRRVAPNPMICLN
jgi:hypothetical protein